MKTSVIVTMYNGEKYIEEQLDSICHQTIAPDEVIIADDCSSDASIHIVERYIQQNNLQCKWKILEHTSNLGLVANMQDGVMHSSGDIIFYADQDDVWLPTKLETMLNAFLKHKDMTLLVARYCLVDSNLKQIISLNNIRNKFCHKLHVCKKRDMRFIFTTRNLAAQSMAFKRSLYNTMQTYYSSPYFFFDTMIATFAAANDGFYTIDTSLTLYRQHGKNISGYIYSPRQFATPNYSRISAIAEQSYLLQNRLTLLKTVGYSKDLSLIENAAHICSERARLLKQKHIIPYLKLLCTTNRYINKRWLLGDIMYLLLHHNKNIS